MDKDWVHLHRTSSEYEQGAWKFVNVAMRNLRNAEKILCPCSDCRNLSHHYGKIVVEHLIIRGMDPIYKSSRYWYNHGEQINISKEIKSNDTYDIFKAIHYEDEDFINHTFFDDDKDEDSAQTEDMKKESSDPSISRVHVWIRSRTQKNGEPVSMVVGDTIEKIKKMENESQSSSTTNVREDALSIVLGQDKPERLRGMGRSMTHTKFILSQANQKQTTQLQNRVAGLEKTVHMLLSQNQGKGSCKDDNASQMNKYEKIHDKCNLLDWTGKDEIVAEGRVLSTDPKELVNNIPLGPNAMKILIDFPKKLNAFLWRPTPRMIIHIGETKDEIIVWPADRVVLHTVEHSEKEDNMSKTRGTNIKCKLYDWIGSKELVAEGRLHSSDPNQLVNNIPLGPSAVLVLIDVAKKPNAFLWRPPAGKTYVGEAIDSKVAWPEANVVVDNINITTSTQTVNDAPYPTSANFKSNTKCKLIALHGAEEVIVEGRVASTDPKVKVPFVPLGENSVKVWVDTVRVPNAPLWRSTSEFEIIEDAIGSTIAWPSSNIIAESTSSNC